MKTHISLRQATVAAYTLIELLTVIAIIAILMALLFAVFGPTKLTAQRASAGAAVRNIVNACSGYNNDYGKYPPVPAASSANGGYHSFGDTMVGGCAVSNEQLFDVLRAIDRGANAGHVLNKRRQTYLEVSAARDSSNPRDGFVDGSRFTNGVQGQLMDPWGAQYCVVLDATSAGTIDMGKFYTDLAGSQNVIRNSAAVFSMGKDGKRGGPRYPNMLRKPGSAESPDDVVSW